MFFPVVVEQDIYNSAGVQQDDINSVLEFVVKKVCHKDGTQATDEDDDQPDYFHIVKTNGFILSNQFDIHIASYTVPIKSYNLFYNPDFSSVTQEITSPPPDLFVCFS